MFTWSSHWHRYCQGKMSDWIEKYQTTFVKAIISISLICFIYLLLRLLVGVAQKCIIVTVPLKELGCRPDDWLDWMVTSVVAQLYYCATHTGAFFIQLLGGQLLWLLYIAALISYVNKMLCYHAFHMDALCIQLLGAKILDSPFEWLHYWGTALQ